MRFRDRFSLIDGMDDLRPHLAAVHRFMPGMRLERDGDVRHCQGTVLADWIARGADGQERGRGDQRVRPGRRRAHRERHGILERATQADTNSIADCRLTITDYEITTIVERTGWYYHTAVMTQPTRFAPGRLHCSSLGPLSALGQPTAPASAAPVKLAIAGVAHGHIGRIVRLIKASSDVELVGVFDKDPALHAVMAKRFDLPPTLFFSDLDVMLDKTRPQAVAAFGTTADHPVVVEAAARRGIHVMMEKPLAVSIADGERIRQAAAKGKVHVIVNYETTWYPSHAAIWTLMKERKAGGEIRKMVAMDGHEGPKEIGVGPEFFDWLTDPVRNGAGALFDFGCYGANLMTWLMDNQRPLAVTAVTQRIKPAIYPRVDDEATILVEYPKAQGIIQALVELAVRPQGPRGLRRHRLCHCDRRQLAARAAAQREAERTETPEPRTPDGTRRAGVLRGDRARHDDAVRAVVAREQPDRQRDPRRRARVGAHGQDYSAGALNRDVRARSRSRVQGPESRVQGPRSRSRSVQSGDIGNKTVRRHG